MKKNYFYKEKFPDGIEDTDKPRQPRIDKFKVSSKDDSVSLDLINNVLNMEGSFQSVLYYAKQRNIPIYPEDIDFFLRMSQSYASYNDNPENRLKYTLQAWEEGVLVSTQKYINRVKKMLNKEDELD